MGPVSQQTHPEVLGQRGAVKGRVKSQVYNVNGEGGEIQDHTETAVGRDG